MLDAQRLIQRQPRGFQSPLNQESRQESQQGLSHPLRSGRGKSTGLTNTPWARVSSKTLKARASYPPQAQEKRRRCIAKGIGADLLCKNLVVSCLWCVTRWFCGLETHLTDICKAHVIRIKWQISRPRFCTLMQGLSLGLSDLHAFLTRWAAQRQRL